MTLREKLGEAIEDVAGPLFEDFHPKHGYGPYVSGERLADAALAFVKDRLTAEINEYPGTEYRRHLIMVRDVLLSTDKGDEG